MKTKFTLLLILFFAIGIIFAQKDLPGDSTKPFSEDHVILTQYKYEMKKRMAMDSVAHAKEVEIIRAELAMMTAKANAKTSQVKLLYVINIALISLLLFLWVRKKKA